VCAVRLLQINLPQGDFYRLQRKAADVDFLTQLLCVTADRSPSLGKSFPGARVWGGLLGVDCTGAASCARA
jgi:hypothetical protein